MSGLQWDLIKNGYSGFEDLAHEYVKSEHPSYEGWIATPKTRDGNKDAISVINPHITMVFGFKSSQNAEEEWWMEAKYSLKTYKLNRYKLDATIVSAILNGNVSKIVFVTNISVNSKTITDIRNALEASINCKDVIFCTKSTIEYWLYKNQKVFQKYFEQTDIDKIKFDNVFVTEDIEFYSVSYRQLAFRESLKLLYTDQNYSASLGIYSNQECELKIILNKKWKDIFILNTSIVKLNKGENNILIDLSIKKNIQKNMDISGVIFKIDNLECLVKSKIAIISLRDETIYIKKQQELIKKLENSFLRFLKKPKLLVSSITGKSGMGKTYIIENVIEKISLKTQNVLFLNFSNDEMENNIILVDLILFLFFPFIPPKEIDSDYLQNIKINSFIDDFLIEIIDGKDEPDKLIKLLANDKAINMLVRNLNYMTAKVIVVDDIHKLSDLGRNFFMKLINDLSEYKINSFILICGQQHFFDSSEYEKFNDKHVIDNYEFVLTARDLFETIQKNQDLPPNINGRMIDTLFSNTIDLLFFLTYLNDLGEKINSIGEFIFIYQSFQSEKIKENYILKNFQVAFENDPEARTWNDRIYRSLNGLNVEADNVIVESPIRVLLAAYLIKYNSEGRLVPYHDTYIEIYKNRYNPVRKNLAITYSNDYEKMYDDINFSENIKQLKETALEIIKLKSEEKYFSIIYILDDLFEKSEVSIKVILGDVLYYELYYVYAYSIANQSTTKSGNSVFSKIYQEIEYHTEPKIKRICVDVISELVNSRYESLLFEEAEKLIMNFNVLINYLVKYKFLDEDYEHLSSYILVKSIETLMLSEKNDINSELLFKSILNILNSVPSNFEKISSFTFRYARTLYARNLEEAFQYLKACKSELEKNKVQDTKSFKLISFEYIYLDLICSKEYIRVFELVEALEKLKDNYLNDYRRGLLGLVAILLIDGELDLATKYFFSDVSIQRELRPRQKGFYSQILALYEILTNNKKDIIINELLNSKKIFGNLKEYSKLIEHNIKIINSNKFDSKKIEFCTDGQFNEGIYYIDPRCCW